jgi:hypothetical protein
VLATAPRVRAVLPGIALLVLACESESQVAPRTPVNAQQTEPMCVAAPALQDGFPSAFAQSQVDDPYRVVRPRSIDLGAIGDSRLNEEPRPRHLAEWEKPFSCRSTNTCAPPQVVVMPWAGPR